MPSLEAMGAGAADRGAPGVEAADTRMGVETADHAGEAAAWGGGRPAVFLDRDGTLIRERHYLADPAGVELIDGAARALAAFRATGHALILVTNQSGIARGLIAVEQYEAVQTRLAELLAAEGVRLDAVYHCPHAPELSGPCDCRKPALGLYRRAIADHGLDPTRSIFIGDRVRDVLPARHLGGTGYLVRTGYGAVEASGVPDGIRVVADLAAVAGELPGLGGAPDMR